jgi:hypothetical protein
VARPVGRYRQREETSKGRHTSPVQDRAPEWLPRLGSFGGIASFTFWDPRHPDHHHAIRSRLGWQAVYKSQASLARSKWPCCIEDSRCDLPVNCRSRKPRRMCCQVLTSRQPWSSPWEHKKKGGNLSQLDSRSNSPSAIGRLFRPHRILTSTIQVIESAVLGDPSNEGVHTATGPVRMGQT